MAEDKENKKDDKNDDKEVTIHIDKQKYESPTPTTGAALYILGKIDAAKYDLFLEVPGPGDDTLVPNDQTKITLKNGAHLYSAQKNLNPGSQQWLI